VKREILNLVKSWLGGKPKKPLLVILGPTASGKTAFAIEIAKEFGGEIINADSKQIYKELEIGSAKPSKEEIKQAKHHLVSIYNPKKVVSVALYRKLVEKKIREILKRKKLPILSGSHTLLISSIVENYQFAKKSDEDLRKELTREYEKDAKKLWKKLEKLNQRFAKKIPYQNKHHLLRALEKEIVEAKSSKGKRKYDVLILGLNPPREKLYVKINKRVERMMKEGLLEEVKSLAKKYPRFSPSLRAHGYRELLDYLHGEKTLEVAIEEIKRDTRNYAKRQMSWWRNSPLHKEIHWF
jgi:tRNA dimethylallyltransferase